MSFFDQLGLVDPIKNDESANIEGGGFAVINGGTQAISIIHKANWVDGFGEGDMPYIRIMLKLLDTSFKDNFVSCKMHIYDKDIAKRGKHASLFSRFYMLLGIAPPASIPTDADLAAFVGHTIAHGVNYWIQQNTQTKNWTHGNWVGSIYPTAGFVCVDGTQPIEDIAAKNANNVPGQAPRQAPTVPQQQAPQPAYNQIQPKPIGPANQNLHQPMQQAASRPVQQQAGQPSAADIAAYIANEEAKKKALEQQTQAITPEQMAEFMAAKATQNAQSQQQAPQNQQATTFTPEQLQQAQQQANPENSWG